MSYPVSRSRYIFFAKNNPVTSNLFLVVLGATVVVTKAYNVIHNTTVFLDESFNLIKISKLLKAFINTMDGSRVPTVESRVE